MDFLVSKQNEVCKFLLNKDYPWKLPQVAIFLYSGGILSNVPDISAVKDYHLQL